MELELELDKRNGPACAPPSPAGPFPSLPDWFPAPRLKGCIYFPQPCLPMTAFYLYSTLSVMNHPDLKQRFLAECGKMDPRHDAFSKVLERVGVAEGDRLKIGELNSLHRVYLEALRNEMQAKAGLASSPSGPA